MIKGQNTAIKIMGEGIHNGKKYDASCYIIYPPRLVSAPEAHSFVQNFINQYVHDNPGVRVLGTTSRQVMIN